MNADILIRKLIEIGFAVGNEKPSTICSLVMEAQDCALQLQCDFAALHFENERLRLPPLARVA
jgi:hypothetical protein